MINTHVCCLKKEEKKKKKNHPMKKMLKEYPKFNYQILEREQVEILLYS